MRKVKILLIDASEIIRILFRDVFWLHGLDDKYELEIAEGVEEAKKILGDPAQKPDVIFVDLVMPMIKDGKKITAPEAGLGLLKEIKGDEKLKSIKVIIFSGHNDKHFKEESEKAGADMFLAKEDHLPQDIVKVIQSL